MRQGPSSVACGRSGFFRYPTGVCIFRQSGFLLRLPQFRCHNRRQQRFLHWALLLPPSFHGQICYCRDRYRLFRNPPLPCYPRKEAEKARLPFPFLDTGTFSYVQAAFFCSSCQPIAASWLFRAVGYSPQFFGSLSLSSPL